MITFLYGTYGSGKSTAVLDKIKKDTEQGIHTFLIVPEQEAVQSERATLLGLPAKAQLSLEVLSFSRLYNRLCREYGGLSYRYVTKPIRHLLMWKNLRELRPHLEVYNSFSDKDTSICDTMLSAISELKACGITPQKLENAANGMPVDDKLRARLIDLALIYSSYDNLVSQSYSDSADDISRLYELLKKEAFFRGTNVYIDSFTSFTAAEHKVIERIFATADNVTVTVPLPSPEYNDISVASICRSHERLQDAAERHGKADIEVLEGNKRAKNKALAHIAENLWRLDLSQKGACVKNDGSIVMEICDTPYAEAEAVAAHILELLRSGERCRDMLVLMRSPENYRGIIEPAFSKNGIPFYFSEKTDLNSLPPVKLLFSAIRIKLYNWQKNDVITHIKTGLYPFSLRSTDLFEEYLQTWNIHGAKFTDTDGWTMNPDGYVKELSPRAKDILAAANDVRRRLTETLEKFFILLDASEDISGMCRAVYTYFTDIKLEDRLNFLALAEEKRGNAKGAAELRSIYGVMLNTLADVAAALPDESATSEEFLLILRAVFNKTEIGTIPTSVDEVTVGSAATARASNPKYTFVLGLCEGEFPAAVNDTGLFSSADRSALKDLRIELSADNDTRSSDELMFAQRSFATPSERLYLFTYNAEFSGKARIPSMPWNRVIALLQKSYKPHRYQGSDLKYIVGAPRSAAAHLRTLEGRVAGETLKLALSDVIPDTKRLCEMSVSADEKITLSKETVDLAIGNSAVFSSTRFEKYANCPLAFYCSSVLKLREKVNSDFLSSDMGTFVHAILENIICYATTKKEDGSLPTDGEITERTEEAVLEYINSVSPLELRSSKRLAHIYDRLKRLALLMVRNILTEFSQSKFVPAFFELSIDDREGSPIPMEIALDDGSSVRFIGKIDRVDVYKDDSGVYIRVIDYKTGTKVFSLDDVEHGINTQMLLYLFMLCKNPSSEFKKALGVTEGSAPIPAGVMYLSADIPTLQATAHIDEETSEKLAADRLKRSGLVLSDPAILRAMNSEMSRKFLAGVYQNKDGTIKGDALTSKEKFEELYTQINDTIIKLMNELKKGNAGASPLRYGKNDPCDFCKMKPVCRKDD